MKWISSLSISLPFIYAITSGIQLDEADHSFLKLVFLQTIASMYHRHVDSEFTLQMDRTIMCALWLYVAFPVDYLYSILFCALFCLYNTHVCKRFTFIITPFCITVYIYHSKEFQLLKLLIACSCVPSYFYNVKHDVEWTRWLWHGLVGLGFFYPLYLHDYAK